MEREPPQRFILSRSIAPTGVSRPSRSRAKASCSSSFSTASTWPAKASCSSMTSMSPSVSPARCSTLGMARAGPSSNSSSGSMAVRHQLTTEANGCISSSRAFCSLIKSTADAPSVRYELLPAVMLPNLRSKAGRSLASFSKEVSPRIPLSASTGSNFGGGRAVTICCSSQPCSVARAAR